MDLKAFSQNWEKARNWCPTLTNRFKYLFWIYGGTPHFFKHWKLKIDFLLAAPVGNLTLNVRCNRGADAFIFSEVFEHRYYDFTLPGVPHTILDLGANIGFTGLYFSNKYPGAEVACVEPMPENVAFLRKNLTVNPVAAHVVAKAIAVEDGTVTMQRAEMDYGHKVNLIGFGKQITGETIEVGAISVPTLMRELGWIRIGLLKVDVEGYEGILLRQNCGWLNQVDAICIECHEGFGEGDLLEIARNHGFHPPQKLPGAWLLIRV